MSQSSRRWLNEHRRDHYVKQAQQQGYRSRAVYKLAEIDRRDQLFFPGMKIVDLGAAPGGWSQWIVERLQGKAQIIAVDVLVMPPLAGVEFIHGDFTEQTVLDLLRQRLENGKLDLVISDMAPNITGIKAVDQSRVILLAELARDFALEFLKPGGNLLVKLFQGEGCDTYLQSLRVHFAKILIRKPAASRARSAEVYLVAKGYR